MDRYGRDFSIDEWKDYTLAVNLACAEIFKDVIEYCRISPNKTGVLWWSLSDMWDMLFNYSVIDSDGNAKLPYHFIKRSQSALCMIALPTETDSPLELFVANGSLASKKVSYKVSAYRASGEEESLASGTMTAEKSSVTSLGTLPSLEKGTLVLMEYSFDGVTLFNHAFPSFADYPTMKELLSLYARKTNLQNDILELL